MFALPEQLLPTASYVVMSCALIPETELLSNVRMLCGKRIVLTHSLVYAEGAGSANGSVCNARFPDMRMAVRALIATPPCLSCSVRLNEDVRSSKMSVLSMIPLELQHWAEQADVWALLLACACVLV